MSLLENIYPRHILKYEAERLPDKAYRVNQLPEVSTSREPNLAKAPGLSLGPAEAMLRLLCIRLCPYLERVERGRHRVADPAVAAAVNLLTAPCLQATRHWTGTSICRRAPRLVL